MSGLLNKTKLIQYFEKGIKKNSQQKIGTEHEKFIFNKANTELIVFIDLIVERILDLFLSKSLRSR